MAVITTAATVTGEPGLRTQTHDHEGPSAPPDVGRAQSQSIPTVALGPPAMDRRAQAGLKGRTAQSLNEVRDAVNKQPKVRLQIRRPERIKKGMHYRIPVTINGYTWQVPTGQWVEVPEEVYLILVRSGHAQPVRPDDEHEVPAFITQEGEEYNLMQAVGAGTVGNPITVQ